MDKLELSTILNETLPYIKEKGRMIDYYRILNMISEENYDKQILNELLKYRNDDGGFGHGLEPDAQMPYSSTLACTIACDILDELNLSEKEDVVEGVVKYLETQFNEDKKSFNYVTKHVDDYPHAVWWNYDGVEEFGYLNPNPEIIGFLYKNNKNFNKINVDDLLEHMKEYLKKNLSTCNKEHSLYSVRKMFNRVDMDDQLEKLLLTQEEETMVKDKDKWHEYVAEPVKFIKDKKHPLFDKYKELVYDNVEFILNSIKDGVWLPTWTWFQFDDVFEKSVKYEWMGYLTYEKLKVLKNFDMIDFDK